MTEKDVETSIIQFINVSGGYAVKVQSGSVLKSHRDKDGKQNTYRINLAPSGTPDILACIKGQFLGIEVKKDKAEVKRWWRQTDTRSQLQKAQLERISDAGGDSYIVFSLEEFIELSKDLIP